VWVQILINFMTMLVGVSFGTYLGAKIMKHELRREITNYIMNEVPHLMASEEFKKQARELARTCIREIGTIIMEELKGGK